MGRLVTDSREFSWQTVAGVASRINLHALTWVRLLRLDLATSEVLLISNRKNVAYFIVNTEKRPAGLYVSSLLVTHVAVDSEYCQVYNLLNVANGSDGPDPPLTLYASRCVTDHAND